MKKLEDEHRCLYIVQRDMENAPKGHEVSVDKSSNNVSCSCKMFESDGIPCRHMVAYFFFMQIRRLPDQYILQRWTKSTKASSVREDLCEGVKEICDTSLLVRRSKLFQRSSNVIDEAVLTEDGTEIVEEALESAEKKPTMKREREDGEGSAIKLTFPLGSQHSFKEPLPARGKGCGKKLKGGKEKSVKKSRRCNRCGLTGQSHDKRNCPTLLNMSS